MFLLNGESLRNMGSKKLQSTDPKKHRGDNSKLILTAVIKDNIFHFVSYGWQI